jgi:electron transfer flavoprotein beta subunit
MNAGVHIVVCAGPVPDPLQTLEPVETSQGPALKNETMLPAVLDPWAAHALYEAAHLARRVSGSRVWLVSLGPRARLQQLMMSVAQKVPFTLVALDGSASGFTDAHEVADRLAGAIASVEGLDRTRLLLFGGMASASRDAGVTISLTAERLGIHDQFLGVDALAVEADGALLVKERIERGRYLVSRCAGPPAALAWATGSLAEPPNNPQVGMQNMRAVLPALQKAAAAAVGAGDVTYVAVERPQARRETRIVKDVSVEEMAQDIVAWMREG